MNFQMNLKKLILVGIFLTLLTGCGKLTLRTPEANKKSQPPQEKPLPINETAIVSTEIPNDESKGIQGFNNDLVEIIGIEKEVKSTGDGFKTVKIVFGVRNLDNNWRRILTPFVYMSQKDFPILTTREGYTYKSASCENDYDTREGSAIIPPGMIVFSSINGFREEIYWSCAIFSIPENSSTDYVTFTYEPHLAFMERTMTLDEMTRYIMNLPKYEIRTKEIYQLGGSNYSGDGLDLNIFNKNDLFSIGDEINVGDMGIFKVNKVDLNNEEINLDLTIVSKHPGYNLKPTFDEIFVHNRLENGNYPFESCYPPTDINYEIPQKVSPLNSINFPLKWKCQYSFIKAYPIWLAVSLDLVEDSPNKTEYFRNFIVKLADDNDKGLVNQSTIQEIQSMEIFLTIGNNPYSEHITSFSADQYNNLFFWVSSPQGKNINFELLLTGPSGDTNQFGPIFRTDPSGKPTNCGQFGSNPPKGNYILKLIPANNSAISKSLEFQVTD
jgi:hypothetical protein